MCETLGVKRHTWVRTFCLSTLAGCLCLFSEQAQAFKIIEPAEGAKLTSGTTVTARVDLGKDSGIVQVRYYWYGEQDDTLVEQEDATATGSIVAEACSFAFAINSVRQTVHDAGRDSISRWGWLRSQKTKGNVEC